MTDPFVIQEGKIKNSFLSRDKRLGWTEEMFDEVGEGNFKIEGESSQFLGLGVSARHVWWLLLAAFLLVGFLAARSFYLQVVAADYYRGLAEGNRLRVVMIKASRGVIFDTTGKQLVKNVPSFDLLITPADLPEDLVKRQEILNSVAGLTGMTIEEIEKILADHKPYIYQPIIIKNNLDYQAMLQALLRETDWPGVTLEEGSRREYLLSDNGQNLLSLSHVFGYLGQLTKDDYEQLKSRGYFLNDQVGKNGLEMIYERELKGINGQQQVEVDALGREKKMVAQDQPVAGQNLTLSLDAGLQQKAEESLVNNLKKFNKQRGAVVALNPQNGEILALVSWPSFNANNFSQGLSGEEYSQLTNNPNKPLFNRAVSGVYPSGSTIKPVMAVAALAEKIITASTSFNSVGGLRIGQWFFPDWKAGGHGVTNVYKAVAESVNTFFFMIGGGYPTGGNPTQGYEFTGLGPERIDKWLKLFGLGEKTGLDLNNEAAGFVPTVTWKNETYKEKWYIGDTYNLSIGQGNLLVTPLQVANWTATIANGGHLYQPQLVQKIGQRAVAPKVVRENFVSDDYLQIARQGMRQAVLAGSARSFGNLPIEVAAKTGTAQWNSNKANHAWFTCFAPYKNPQIVVTVLIEEGEEGSLTAAAVARDLMSYYAGQIQK